MIGGAAKRGTPMKNVVVFVGIMLAVGGVPLVAAPTPPADAHIKPAMSLSDYTLTNWTEEQGPFPFGIYAIAQDHDGYLWLGARTGLVRFDGSEFLPWAGRQALPDDRVAAILAAHDGSLWVGFGTVGGVARIVGDAVTQFTTRDGLAEGGVPAIVQDQQGTIWVASHGGLSEYDGQRWRTVGEDEGLNRTPVLSLWCDSRGALWVGTAAGLYRRDAGGRRFTLIDPVTGGELGEDLSGTVWVTDPRDTFHSVGPPNVRDSQARARKGFGRQLLIDRRGALWVGTRGSGLLRVPGDAAGVYPELLEHLTRRQGLISDEVRALFEDQNGGLWIGTRRGLSRLSESNIRSALTESGSDSFVAAVTATRDGAVWTATATGLTRELGSATRTFSEQDGLPSGMVTALHEDQRGTLWAATTFGLARFVGQRFVAMSVLPGTSSTAYQIRSITSEKNGALWLCDQSRGLFRWQNGVMESLGGLVGQRKPYAVYTDRADRVWVGFWEGGVSVFDQGRVSTYSTEQGLPPGSVNIMFEDRSGGLWVATDHALGRIEGERVRTFTANGLPQSGVVSMVEDPAGDLWIGLGPSLLKIDPREFDAAAADPGYQLRYKLFGAEDGIPGTLGRPGLPSSARTADGRLLFVTSVGLAVVDPRRLHDRAPPRLIRVNAVSADGQAMAPVGNTVTIPARNTRLAIKYSVLSLAAASSRFRYKLEGFDADWQYAGEKREVSYTNLPPGDYTFRVASNHDGAWIEARTPLAVSLLPAFYQTKVFYAFAVSLLAVLLWFAWRRHVRHIKREFDLVLAERTRVGREIHDTLLQSLVAVALEFDDISEQLGPRQVALKSQVVHIRSRVEQYILEARQSILNLRSPMLEHSDLVTTLKRAGESATANRGVRFEFALQGMARRLDETLEEQLLRIGQEAVSNAVRHGAASVIVMELCFDHAGVRLRVSDDGCGFHSDQPSHRSDSHWGIAGMRERAERVGADLRVISQPGVGTTVEALVSDLS